MYFQRKFSSLPISINLSGDTFKASLNIFAIDSVPGSIHHPHFKSSISFQGDALVVITGIPNDKASATTIPKFSEKVGNMNRSADLNI